MDSRSAVPFRAPAYHSYGSSSSHQNAASPTDDDGEAPFVRELNPQTAINGMEEEDGTQGYPATASLSTTTTTTTSSKYFDYPTTKPFINTNFTRADKPVNAYPTSDRDAVVSALRNLQDKVKKLELERNAAEQNLQSLTSETDQYREVLTNGRSSSARSPRPTKTSTVNSQTKELEGQLSSAESRCQLLEQQLDYMRKMVDNSERDRRELMQKTLLARQEKEAAAGSKQDLKLHLGRLHDLEKDQLRLTATQSLAERIEQENNKAKIKELEERVKQEKIHRKTLQERTTQLESARKEKGAAPAHTVHSATQASLQPPAPTIQQPVAKKAPRKKKKKAPPKRPVSACKTEPTRHYRLNLAEIPFVAGKSTTPSHSLGANVQKVLAMMKSHNTALCNNHVPPQPSSARLARRGQRSLSPTASESTETSSSAHSLDQDLCDVLAQLQDEFGQLSSEHQELVYQLHASREQAVRERLEQEMDALVGRMEAKGQQIAKVRQHQNKLEDVKKVKLSSKPASDKARHPHSASSQHPHHPTHPSAASWARPRSNNCHRKPIGNSALGKPALFMLRDMKKLQTTLRRDDLCWE